MGNENKIFKGIKEVLSDGDFLKEVIKTIIKPKSLNSVVVWFGLGLTITSLLDIVTIGVLKSFGLEVEESTDWIAGIGLVFMGLSFETIKLRKEDKVPEHKKLTENDLKKLLTSLPPNDTFIGREKELKEIYKNLSKNKSLLLLNGIGGIGKTALAKEYTNRYIDKYDHIAFVEFSGDIKDSLISSLESHFKLEGDTLDKKFTNLKTKLANIKGKNLLVIDDIKTQDDFNIIKKISSNFELLITSRNEFDAIYKQKVETLPLEESKELFFKYYNTNDNIEPLLESLGYHTLFIKLTAQTLSKSSLLTPQKIQERFKNGELKTIKNNSDSKTFNIYLEELFQDNDLNEKEILTLKRLSIFPSIEIEFELLQEFLCIEEEDLDEFDFILNTLSSKGWLIKEENSFKLHQIIKEFIIDEYKVRFEHCEVVVQFFIEKLYLNPEDNPVDKFKYLRYLTSIDSILKDRHERMATLFNNMSIIYKVMGEFEQALEYQKKDLELSKEILGDKHPNLAISYNNISLIYRNMGELDQALHFQKKALELKEEILNDKHPDLASSYNNISLIYKDMGELEKALDYQKKTLELFEKILGDKHPDLATSYNNISLIYEKLGDFENDLKYQIKSLEIREEIFKGNHPDLALSYNNIAISYLNYNDLKNAKTYIDMATKIRKEIYKSDHPHLIASLKTQAYINSLI